MRPEPLVVKGPGGDPFKLDAIDLRILDALCRNARIKLTELSEEAAVSATRCAERIKRMEKLGVIAGYSADVRIEKMIPLQNFFVQVTITDYQHDKAVRFERTVQASDQVLSCNNVLGNVDYLLLVTARDISQYQVLIAKLVEDSGVDFDYVTYPVSGSVKTLQSLPVAKLIDLVQGE